LRYSQLYIVLVCTLLLSCNLFDTRDAENPVSGNQTLQTAFSKEILYGNFILAFKQKNIQEYGKLFADTVTHVQSFTFIPTQSSGARYSSVFMSWNKNSETEYFGNAISAVGISSSIEFIVTSVPQIIAREPDSAQYTFTYTLFIPHNRSDVKLQQFEGRCEITMSPGKDNPIWKIYRWIDYETKKDSSWSELKGQFAK